MYFLRLIRFKNLLIIILTLFLIHSFYIIRLEKQLGLSSFVNSIDFYLFILGIILIAGAGNIINDVFDIKIDSINKPEKQIISKKITIQKAIFIYVTFNIVALIIGTYLGLKYNKKLLIIFFGFSIFLLYIYSKFLKSRALIGNLVISFLTAIIIILLVWFEFTNTVFISHFFVLSYIIALFAFLLNLIREIVKDIQDYKGDLQNNLKTLPIVIGKEKSLVLAKFIAVITLVLLAFMLPELFSIKKYIAIIFLILLMIIILIFIVKTNTKNTKTASMLLKISMLIGLLSIPFIT